MNRSEAKGPDIFEALTEAKYQYNSGYDTRKRTE